jgi:hypothetical protein
VVSLSHQGVQVHSTHAIRVTLLDTDMPADWVGPTAVVDGQTVEVQTVEVEGNPRVVAACLRQIECAEEIVEALGDGRGEDVQEELDELVADTVLGRYLAEHGTLRNQVITEAEAEASTLNNQGVAAQVCEIVAHGDLERLRTLAGLNPPTSSRACEALPMKRYVLFNRREYRTSGDGAGYWDKPRGLDRP